MQPLADSHSTDLSCVRSTRQAAKGAVARVKDILQKQAGHSCCCPQPRRAGSPVLEKLQRAFLPEACILIMSFVSGRSPQP